MNVIYVNPYLKKGQINSSFKEFLEFYQLNSLFLAVAF